MNWKIWTLISLPILVLGFILLGIPNKIMEKTEANSVLVTKDAIPTDGAILGAVIAPKATVTICASNNSSTLKGTVSEKGEFFINGFDDGVYNVIISATKNGTLQISQIEDVMIRQGEVTALGTIDMTMY